MLHELLGRVASELRLLDLFWSDELLVEARRSLVAKKGLSSEVAQRWVDYLPQSFPAGNTDLDVVPAAIDLSNLTTDPADHHVCALVVAAGADYLFTNDRGYLREGLRSFDVEVVAPDEFLAPRSTPTFGDCSTSWSCRQAAGREGDLSRSCSTRSSAPARRLWLRRSAVY